MKEFKYNIKILLRKKELYYCIIGVLLINAIHVILVINHYSPNMILKTGEYQFILYNNEVTIMSLVIIALPILTSLVLSDTSWNDKHLGYNNYLYTRLNIKKNIFSRLFLSFITTFIICFVGFILNYLTLRFIFGSGNLITNFQELPYDQVIASEFFLDSIRYYNPILFIILISLHESVIIGLLATISYSFSFFTMQKLIIYFQVTLIMIILEVVFSFIGISQFSIIKQLQPNSSFSVYQSIILYIVLSLIAITPVLLITKKGDIL
ncbi:hypothetical protein DW649_12080 [Coprobacillus sp. AM23-2]|nr:hypothetical protein DW649_12080 [Coprobacillus sp. AM23-2]